MDELTVVPVGLERHITGLTCLVVWVFLAIIGGVELVATRVGNGALCLLLPCIGLSMVMGNALDRIGDQLLGPRAGRG